MAFPSVSTTSNGDASAALVSACQANGLNVGGLNPLAQVQLAVANALTNAPPVAVNPLYVGTYGSLLPALISANTSLGCSVQFDVVRVGSPAQIRGIQVGTSLSAPTAVGNGSNLCDFAALGYDGSVLGQGGAVRFRTTEAWTSTAHGTKIQFFTTPNGSVTNGVALTLDQDLSATFGLTVTTAAPTGGAGAWKLGIANVVSPTAPNRTVTIDIGGTTYYLAAKTTND